MLAAFGLAACGGGSGGTADTMPEPPPPTQAELDAMEIARLQGQIDALRMQLGLGADGDLSQSITDLMAERDGLQQQVDDAADAEEAARLEAERKAAEEAAAAMAATAAKLYAGIGDTPLLATARSAAYGTGDNAADIAVTIDGGTAVNLSEDEDAMVAARHGWQGQMFTAEPEGEAGTYEAHVYSHVGDPTEGAMFNAGTANGGYDLNADDQIANVTTVTDYAGLVASPSFDQAAGTKTFDLAENREYLEFSGTFNGVPGTYTCTPTAIDTDRDTCGATVATSGFTLVGGTWTFEPNDPEQRLMNVPDAVYASYGWWLHKSEDGDTYTASAFHAYRGTDAGTVGIADLRGMARYTGGAAGKYALRGDTGGTNDAGHFTADVTLDATFGADHMISGTVSNFTGGDGMSRDWTVGLNASVISDTGAIAGDPEDSTDTDPQMTVWTIDGTAGDADGSWSGTLREQGDDGVPGIVTGTFHATYGHGGNDGRMVGAFGANE